MSKRDKNFSSTDKQKKELNDLFHQKLMEEISKTMTLEEIEARDKRLKEKYKVK